MCNNEVYAQDFQPSMLGMTGQKRVRLLTIPRTSLNDNILKVFWVDIVIGLDNDDDERSKR